MQRGGSSTAKGATARGGAQQQHTRLRTPRASLRARPAATAASAATARRGAARRAEEETRRKLSRRFAAVAARRCRLRGEAPPRAGDPVAVDALGFAQAALGSDVVARCPLSIARLFGSAAAPAARGGGATAAAATAALSEGAYLALMKGALRLAAPEAERTRCAFAALADAGVRLGAGWMHARSAGSRRWRKRWVHLRAPQRRTLQRGVGSERESAASAPAATSADSDAAHTTLRLYKARDPGAVERCLLRGEAERAEGEELVMRVVSSTRVDATTLEVVGRDVASGGAGELALRTQSAAQCDALERALRRHGGDRTDRADGDGRRWRRSVLQ